MRAFGNAETIEHVSGKDYGTFLKENIFDPIGMQNSGHDTGDGSQLEQSAKGYAPVGLIDVKKAPTLNWTVKTGNGSLYSTVEDMYKWHRALHEGKLLKPGTLKQIFKNHLSGTGYGWFNLPHLNRARVYINGRSPGFPSYHVRYIEGEITIIILNNMYNSLPTPWERISPLLYWMNPMRFPDFHPRNQKRR